MKYINIFISGLVFLLCGYNGFAINVPGDNTQTKKTESNVDAKPPVSPSSQVEFILNDYRPAGGNKALCVVLQSKESSGCPSNCSRIIYKETKSKENNRFQLHQLILTNYGYGACSQCTTWNYYLSAWPDCHDNESNSDYWGTIVTTPCTKKVLLNIDYLKVHNPQWGTYVDIQYIPNKDRVCNQNSN